MAKGKAQTVKDIARAIEVIDRGHRADLELVFVNSDSGWRKVSKVEADVKGNRIWLYELRESDANG